MIASSVINFRPAARQRGFTLLELVIALVVVAVMVLMALPSFRETGVRNNVSSINNNLLHAFNVARAEAVRRGVNVTVTASGGVWNNGWVVATTGATTATLLNQDAIPKGGYSVCGKTTGGGTDTVITFNSLGALAGGATSFDVNVNRPDGNVLLAQRLTIGASGQVQVKQNATGSPAATSC